MKFKVIEHKEIFRPSTGAQAYYPKMVKLSENEYLCSFIASKEMESIDSHTEILRSVDCGKTWINEGPVVPNCLDRENFTEIGFIDKNGDGKLIYTAARWRNTTPPLPLINPSTIGMRDNEMLMRQSDDSGKTWSASGIVPSILDVPVETPSSPFFFNDNSLMLPFATWKKWDGSCPYGHTIYAIQTDKTMSKWSAPVEVIKDPTATIGFWEPRISMLNKSTLIATCWAHDWKTDVDIQNHFAVSDDKGRSWKGPFKSKVNGQTGFPLFLEENLILFVYNHRKNPVGIRGQIAEIRNEEWKTIFDGEIWSPANKKASAISKKEYGVTNFQFGMPRALFIAEKEIMVTYWAVENGRSGINCSIIEME